MKKNKNIMYIEQKTDGKEFLNHQGPAVIAEIEFSKSGKTIYYRGKSFYRIGSGLYGNYLCEETGDEYWISGVKKRGSNRHWAGSGPVEIEVSEEKLI